MQDFVLQRMKVGWGGPTSFVHFEGHFKEFGIVESTKLSKASCSKLQIATNKVEWSISV